MFTFNVISYINIFAIPSGVNFTSDVVVRFAKPFLLVISLNVLVKKAAKITVMVINKVLLIHSSLEEGSTK